LSLRRRAAGAAIAVLVALVSGGCGPTPRLAGDALPATLQARMQRAKGFEVVRLGNVAGPGATGGPVFARRELQGQGAADAAWRARFDSLLATRGWHPAALTAAGHATSPACYGVRFADWGHVIDVVVDLDARVVEMGQDGVLFAARDAGPSLAAWTALGRAAFPGDSAFRARVELPDQLPDPVHVVRARWPVSAWLARRSCAVLIAAHVAADGRVDSTHIVRSDPTFDAAAIAAVRQWRFRPAMAGGHPTPAWTVVPMNFPRPATLAPRR